MKYIQKKHKKRKIEKRNMCFEIMRRVKGQIDTTLYIGGSCEDFWFSHVFRLLGIFW